MVNSLILLAEQMYSKDEMEQMYSYGYNNYMRLERAFEQFKKK